MQNARPLFRHHRGRRPADAAEAEERRQHQAGGRLGRRRRPDEKTATATTARSSTNDGAFALASASLRQALQDMPEIAEVSKHIMIEETKQGLNIEIVDQDGRSMFPEGSKEPYERTRRLVQRLAGAAQGDAVPHLDHRPHRGEQACRRKPGYGPWELSADRANAVRKILEEEGVPPAQLLHGRRPGRHPAAVPGRSLRRGQSPRDHHADARGAAAFRSISSPEFAGLFSTATIDAGRCCFRRGRCIKPAPRCCDATEAGRP